MAQPALRRVSTAPQRDEHAERAVLHALLPADAAAHIASDWAATLLLVTRQRRLVWRVIYVELVKRVLDVCVAVALLPLLLLLALALRLSVPGPLLYRQTRIGRGGEAFTALKFRTMIDDRRQYDQQIAFGERRRRHKSAADPRVTRLGRWLRATSVDELPQLLNVLRGEMSLVGPRPELPEIVERYAAWQHARHLVRPGLTGWWQINGRGDLPLHEHTELDLYYVEHVSAWLDLRIVLRTFGAIARRRGAF